MIYIYIYKNVHKNKCWLFHGLIKYIIKKNKLFYKFKINKSSINDIIYKEIYTPCTKSVFLKFLSKLNLITTVSI